MLRTTSTRCDASATAVVLSAGQVIGDAKVEELTHTMDLELLICRNERMNSRLAIAQKNLRLLVRDKGALFWGCMLPIAFGFASLALGRFWRRARVH
jgi:hypothetical protein